MSILIKVRPLGVRHEGSVGPESPHCVSISDRFSTNPNPRQAKRCCRLPSYLCLGVRAPSRSCRLVVRWSVQTRRPDCPVPREVRHATSPRFPLSWRRSWKVIPACVLAFAGWGCQQPPCFYYGYGAPPCAPVMPAPTGTVCDPPAPTLGATTSSDAGNSSPTVAGSRSSPRVVVSEPDNGLRLPWKRSNPTRASRRPASRAPSANRPSISDGSP